MDNDLGGVVAHYEASREQDRLVGGLAELELVRTREILRRHLPPPPIRILDVGGGTGVHAAWLLRDGYRVHREIVRRDLVDGCHANPDNRPHWFTTAFFHHPEQLHEEITAAGLVLIELLGVEGIAGWLPQLGARWGRDADRETILEATRLVEAEPTLLGLSAHLLAIARAPGD